jgi:hypothetical protein
MTASPPSWEVPIRYEVQTLSQPLRDAGWRA